MAERDCSGVGSAQRRRERRLRSWLRHERMSASHHSVQPDERLDTHFAPRGQTNTGAYGRPPGAQKEPGPPLQWVAPTGCPRTTVPSLALADLGGGSEVVDSSALGWLVNRGLNEQRWAKDAEGIAGSAGARGCHGAARAEDE